MHPYLTRLGVREEVQRFFEPFIDAGEKGLLFNYGDAVEHYGFAFHRIPVSQNFWIAGNLNFSMVSEVIICSSAMEAVAFFHYHFNRFRCTDNLLFLSGGVKPNTEQFRWIHRNLGGKSFMLVYGAGTLDHISCVKMASGIREMSLKVHLDDNKVNIGFRQKLYSLAEEKFTLNAFEKLSGYRFNIKTAAPKGYSSFLDQLKFAAFNH